MPLLVDFTDKVLFSSILQIVIQTLMVCNCTFFVSLVRNVYTACVNDL